MPQKTNLNISPYYDDFSKDNQFYRVLFNPGRPVQARELTTLQSILQDQVESFGSHIFKEGSMVIPGNTSYDYEYFSIKLQSDHLGVPVSLYVDNLIGKILVGQETGIKIKVDNYALPENSSEITDLTIFVKYLDAGTSNEVSFMADGENLLVEESFIYGNTQITAGETIATLIELNACNTGSAVSIGDGVFFIRGHFVNVAADKIVLDPYSNVPNYRVGLFIQEEIIQAKDDSSLFDNARGFSNFAAPGADRLKITTRLTKKPLTDYNDKNFVELVRLDNGQLKKNEQKPDYSLIKDYFAKRTFEESGNYSVGNFKINVAECLDDGISNEGVFKEGELTDQRNTPEESLMCVKVSPGKAYVRGHDIEKSGTTVIDVDKTRDKEEFKNSKVNFKLGTLFKLNNVHGTPILGLNQTFANQTISLRDQRKGTGNNPGAAGNQIGFARVYAFENTDASFLDKTTKFDLYVYDVQIFTQIIASGAFSSSTAPVGSFIEGLSSGATGFTVSAGAGSGTLLLEQVSGTFIDGEQIKINGSTSIGANGEVRSIVSVDKFGLEDVMSVHQECDAVFGTGVDFSGDLVLNPVPIKELSPSDSINIASGVVKCAGKTFRSIKANDIIIISNEGEDDPRFMRVSTAPTGTLKQFTVSAVTDVDGVCVASVADGNFTGVRIGRPQIFQNNVGLYAELPKKNVSDASLAQSKLFVKAQAQKSVSSGTIQLTIGSDFPEFASTSTFAPYDGDRYSISLKTSASTIHDQLDESQVVLSNNNRTITFSGLSGTSARVISVTLEKDLINNKTKNISRSNSIVVNKTSRVGVSTNGITHSKAYGLRVDDKEVSLNTPDVFNIVGVFESVNLSDPVLDKLVFVSGLSLDTNSILGEKIKGAVSGAIAVVTERTNATTVEISTLTANKFIIGESVTFQESNITTNLQGITNGLFLDVTSNFKLDDGQRDEFSDYSRIVRKDGSNIPSRRLRVIFDKFTVPANDTGDVFTVASYPSENFKDVPILKNGLRSTDTLDFRPRVADFSGSTSPFAYSSRVFSSSGSNSTIIVAPNEASTLDFKFFLPRIDKVIIDSSDNSVNAYTDGYIQVIKGISSQNPIVPSDIETAMTIGTIEVPAYLYNVKDVKINLVDNRRYTMRDIGKIEDRIENLEELTSLSLLELDTKALQIQDADGLSRFKSGFFVDDFKNTNLLDRLNPDCKCDVIESSQTLVTPTDFYSIKPQLALDPSLNPSTVDFSDNLALLDSGARKTGDLITLDYDEVVLLDQPLASRVENVNPFNIVSFRGNMILSPSADTWTRNVILNDGTRTVLGDTEETFTNDRIVSSVPDTHIRSRNVSFDASGLSPNTRFYAFFDSQSGIDIIPKLIEISMDSGAFDINETVEGFDGADRIFVARTCAPNHKTGSISNPTTVFTTNPYNTALTLPSLYSSSSTVLNIDIASLVEEAQGRFFGFIQQGIKLVGSQSQATATIRPIRLISDILGDLIGSFFFRDPLGSPVPQLRFENGTKTFKLTSSASNSRPLLGSPSISEVETDYRTSGVVDTFRQSTVVVRLPPPPPQPVVFNITNEFITNEITNITEVTEVTNVTNVTNNITNVTEVTEVIREQVIIQRGDPLAQSFTVDESGAFLTAVDLYFRSKDIKEKLTVQVRTMELGIPTLVLLQDFAQVVLEPSQVNISEDASVATRVTFPSPIFLPSGEEYCIVLLAPSSNNYEAWVGRMGEPTIQTQSLPDAESVVISKQYIGGSLFKSQNGSIWTPSQFEDLKLTLYKADFSKSRDAEVIFYNPELNYESSLIPTLGNNAIRSLPRKLKVKIDTGATQSEIEAGKIIAAGQAGISTTPKGTVERHGGPTATLSIRNPGSEYPSSGTVNNVTTFAITGNGTGATLNVTFGSGGVVSSITDNNDGTGYTVGDLIGINTSFTGITQGSGAIFSVDSIGSIDTLYLTDVQGEKFEDNTALLHFNGTQFVALTGNKLVDNVGNLDQEIGGGLFSGNVIEVTQYNHGMHSGNNKVEISNIQPTTEPVVLNAAVGLSSSSIDLNAPATGLNSTLDFQVFEGISTSRGYVKVNNEIMQYDGINTSNESLTIVERGVDGSAIREHAVGSLVYKYEFNGFSLTGINSVHTLPSTSILRTESDIDKYYLEIPRGAKFNTGPAPAVRTSGNSQLSFFTDAFAGGNQIFASQNVQYNQIYPIINNITPGQTAISAKTRTVSGTSAGGSEVSFQDQGFENIELNTINVLSSPRLVASPVNESARLPELPLNRSNTISIRMLSGDKNLSPVIDTMNSSIIYIRNRLNKPIDDYSKDARVKLNTNDPHAGVYISKRVDLKQPATSLQVFLTAQRSESADFRVLYKLFNSEISEGEQSYDLFPGFDNMLDTNSDGFGDVGISTSKNSGRPDAKVPSSVDGEFLEYQFTADNLSEFTGFVIKVVFSGTNEAEAPRVSDLRAIALA